MEAESHSLLRLSSLVQPMARPAAPPNLESLPDELLLHIISFLEPKEVIPLHKASHRLRSLTRQDPTLWRNATIAAHEEKLREVKKGRNQIQLPLPQQALHSNDDSQTGARVGVAIDYSRTSYSHHLPINMLSSNCSKIDWYEEYKWRFAPLRLDWLDHFSYSKGWEDGESDGDDEAGTCPSASYSSTCSSSTSLGSQTLGEYEDNLEIRGISAFPSVPSTGEKDLLLTPLSDGSVVVFDLRRKRGGTHRCNMGRNMVLGRSRPGLLTVEMSSGGGSYLIGGNGSTLAGQVTKAVAPSGVVECVSVDAWSGKGYVAIEGRLVEIDLRTLRRTSTHPFPFTITSLSQTSHPFPLTVGTTNMLHLHDPRISPSTTSASPTNATLFQPGPLSILHSNSGGENEHITQGGEKMIYVAGRFPSVLVYERRMFPRLKITLHSGARLCALSSFPAPSPVKIAPDSNSFSVGAGITNGGTNGELKEIIVAGGEYNGRGALELYPSPYGDPKNISPLNRPPPWSQNVDMDGRSRWFSYPTSTVSRNSSHQPDIVVQNRQTASRTKILTVDSTQGGRIITGDAEGIIRFMERDGRGEIRRFESGEEADNERCPHRRRMHRRWMLGGTGSGRVWGDGDVGYGAGNAWTGEVVRKVVAFGDIGGVDEYSSKLSYKRSDSGVIVWTGERAGILSIGSNKCNVDDGLDGHEGVMSFESDEENESQEARYRREMRQALEHHGREGWFLRGLGREG